MLLVEENVALLSSTVIMNVRDLSREMNPVYTAEPRKKSWSVFGAGYRTCPLKLLYFAKEYGMENAFWPRNCKDMMNIRDLLRRKNGLPFAKLVGRNPKHTCLKEYSIGKLGMLSQKKSVLDELQNRWLKYSLCYSSSKYSNRQQYCAPAIIN